MEQIDETVKRPLRLKAGEAEAVQAVHDQAAAHVVFVAHLGDVVVVALRSASIDAYCDIVGALIIAYWCSFVIGAISSFGPPR